MEINSKQFLIVAAIGAAAWFLLRGKSGGVIAAAKPAPTPAGTNASIWDGFGVSDFAGMAQAIAGGGNGAQQPVTAPAQAPAGAQETGVTFGGQASQGGSIDPFSSVTVSDSGLRTYADGTTSQMSEVDLMIHRQNKANSGNYTAKLGF